MRVSRRQRLLLGCAGAVGCVWLAPEPARAVIVSSGDVKPPFALIGPSSAFTVPANGSTSGGVIVGDLTNGSLTIDNAWTLNTTYGIIANDVGSGMSSGSQVTLDAGSTWNLSLDLDIGNGAYGSAHVQVGSAINARAIRIAGQSNSSGTLNVSSASTVTASSGTFVGVGGAGSVLASGASTLNTDYMVLADQFGSAGNAFFNGAARLHSVGGVIVGGRGLGAVQMTGGSTAQVLFTTIGQDPDAPGQSGITPLDNQVSLSDSGTFYSNAEGFIVGYNTKGSATIESGARLDAGFLEVSAFADDGFLTVRSGAQVNLRPGGGVTTPSLIFGTTPGSIAGGLVSDAGTVVNVNTPDAFAEIARGGEAAVNVAGGAVVNAGSSLMATDAGSVGTLLLSGAGSAWNTSASFEVGRGGEATLTVQDGAALHAAFFLIVGGDAGSSGNVVVDGAGTSPATVWSSAQGLFGVHGDASVIVQNGGKLDTLKAASATATSGLLAQFNDSAAIVTVRGTGSLWSGDGGVNVGFRGQGSLLIENGARVECADGIIARIDGAAGTVALSGSNSLWVIANNLFVGGRPASSVSGAEGEAGPGGVANLLVSSGAAVTLGNTLRLFHAGTIDLTAGGSISVASATTAAPGTLRIFSGGSLFGSGQVKGVVINNGQLNPGDSTGTLTITGTLQTTGTMNIELNSATDFDKISVSSATTLGGALALAPVVGFTLAAGQRLDILTAAALSGHFASASGNRIDSTHWLAVLQGPTKVSLALALPGDATLDGTVNFDDLLILAQNYGGSGSFFDWTRGNFDGNATVNFDDLLALAQRYGNSSLASDPIVTPDVWSDWALARSIAPEPGPFATLASGLLLRRRRSR